MGGSSGRRVQFTQEKTNWVSKSQVGIGKGQGSKSLLELGERQVGDGERWVMSGDKRNLSETRKPPRAERERNAEQGKIMVVREWKNRKQNTSNLHVFESALRAPPYL